MSEGTRALKKIDPIVDPSFGINVTIHIGCTCEQEIYTHLKVLASHFKKAFKNAEDFPLERFEDNNCYGTHDAVIVQSE